MLLPPFAMKKLGPIGMPKKGKLNVNGLMYSQDPKSHWDRMIWMRIQKMDLSLFSGM